MSINYRYAKTNKYPRRADPTRSSRTLVRSLQGASSQQFITVDLTGSNLDYL